MWTKVNPNAGLEAIMMALFTRCLGWSKEEVLAYLDDLKTAFYVYSVHVTQTG